MRQDQWSPNIIQKLIVIVIQLLIIISHTESVSFWVQ